MNEDVYISILNSQKIEYAIYDSSLKLVESSPNLPYFLSPDRVVEVNAHITDTFIELLGYEQYLAEIQAGKVPSLQLDWINQIPLSVPPGKEGAHQPVAFFHLQVYPFHSGVLVVLRDISHESGIEQLVYNQHNKLDILAKKLISELERANQELNQAYLTTLEGWARALEMRDVETKGHSDRVVNLTRNLCLAMGIDNDEITIYCYGALLHDIGKMGIPDSILLKPGELDAAEWATMKQHPVIAGNLLSPIKYLEKAICIPLYHHEKWNGAGYPFGLKGEEIPLPARIFSVVDVYDALSSNRPYRFAWAKKKNLQYIAERSGWDFDPQVVKSFLALYPEVPTEE